MGWVGAVAHTQAALGVASSASIITASSSRKHCRTAGPQCGFVSRWGGVQRGLGRARSSAAAERCLVSVAGPTCVCVRVCVYVRVCVCVFLSGCAWHRAFLGYSLQFTHLSLLVLLHVRRRLMLLITQHTHVQTRTTHTSNITSRTCIAHTLHVRIASALHKHTRPMHCTAHTHSPHIARTHSPHMTCTRIASAPHKHTRPMHSTALTHGPHIARTHSPHDMHTHSQCTVQTHRCTLFYAWHLCRVGQNHIHTVCIRNYWQEK